jgi:hypothetical protein
VEIDLSRPILERNDTLAAANRARLAAAGTFALDVLASPERPPPSWPPWPSSAIGSVSR